MDTVCIPYYLENKNTILLEIRILIYIIDMNLVFVDHIVENLLQFFEFLLRVD